jgi:uncharacterized protein YgbK (DUF1537 family)
MSAQRQPSERRAALPRVAFYGDDFTGAAENMAQYHRHGLTTLLFVNVPDAALLKSAYERYDVIGIAGVSRSEAPEAMKAEVGSALAAFKALPFDVIQYKLCSTFDSSPAIGNLGVVIDEALRAYPQALLSMTVAAPDFGRYTLFGNHFAFFGGNVHRLDRHPSLSRHPITPMDEADLALHLNRQRPTRTALVDVRQLKGPAEALLKHVRSAIDAGSEVLLFDALDNVDLAAGTQSLLDASGGRVLFSLSSQGLAVGLGRLFGEAQTPEAIDATPHAAPVPAMLVLSGSCSLQSAAQVEHAIAAGWLGLRLDTTLALDEPAWNAALAKVADQAQSALADGRSVVVYTSLGPDDDFVLRTQALLKARAVAISSLSPLLGRGFASIAARAVHGSGVKRLLVAGGDTSSHTMRSMPVDALEMQHANYPLSTHICRMQSTHAAWAQCEVLLKGGQGGPVDLYPLALSGRGWH